MCIAALYGDNHPEGITNIVTGRIVPDSVNVANLMSFETGWPEMPMIIYQTKWLLCLSARSVHQTMIIRLLRYYPHLLERHGH